MANTSAHRARPKARDNAPGLRVALDVSSFGFAIFDRDLKLVTCNKAFSEMRGYPADLCKPGIHIADLYRFNAQRRDYGAGDVEALVKSRLEQTQKFKPYAVEYELSTGRTLSTSYHPIDDTRLLLTSTDVTESKHTETALRQAEARNALIEQAATEGIYEWFIEESKLNASPRMKQIFGLKSGESGATNWNWNERVHPDDFERYKDSLRDHFRGLTDTYECEYRVRDEVGTYRWFRDRGVCVRNEAGQAIRLVGAISDLTEHINRETELAQKSAILESTLENMGQGISMVDADLRVIAFNQVFLQLLDFPPDKFKLGYHMSEAFRFNAERGEYGPGDVEQQVHERLELAKKFEPHQFERIRPDGTVIRIHGSPLRDKQGFVTTYTDITNLKRAERELVEKEAQLRVALDNMPGGMTLVDKAQNWVFLNQQYIDLHDFPDGLIRIGENIRHEAEFQAKRGDFGSGDPVTKVEEVLENYRVTDAVSWERTIANGRTLQFHTAPTPDGGNATIVTDITERKRAEEALLEAKRRSEEAGKLVAEKNRMLESLSSQLSKYLPPQVYASIFSGEQTVEIASKRKKLTVFLSDIADFTEITDSLESEELTNLLNHYLTEMSKIAHEYGATIDKYVGDGITGFFGDPESRGVKEDARACVNMAIAMQQRMQELQSEWLDRGLEKPFQIRIGINTGFCTVGNFGSEDRMDYTINGSEVNLAARLESHAEVGGILLGHETYSLVKDKLLAEERDALTVKGFAKPVRTYSVVGLYDNLTEQGRIIHKEQDGVRVLVELKKGDKAHAIQVIKEVLSQLED